MVAHTDSMNSTIKVYGTLIALSVVGCTREPTPVQPTSSTEQRVLALAAAQVPDDWIVPIEITQQPLGTYRVTYWTPPDELELLGPRQAIVDPARQTVELVLRD
jgi:hypothetical protein